MRFVVVRSLSFFQEYNTLVLFLPLTLPFHSIHANQYLYHLSVLAMTDTFEFLTQENVTTKVGILLGMAATRCTTCDPSVSKMLCLHIPSLLPPSFAAMEVACEAQAAAAAGI